MPRNILDIYPDGHIEQHEVKDIITPLRHGFLREMKIDCPYCMVGHGVVRVKQASDGATEIEGMKEPHQCKACHRFFTIATTVQFVGKKMPFNERPHNQAERTQRPE